MRSASAWKTPGAQPPTLTIFVINEESAEAFGLAPCGDRAVLPLFATYRYPPVTRQHRPNASSAVRASG
jgi:hypothetical protein